MKIEDIYEIISGKLMELLETNLMKLLHVKTN